jgi:hypothetical protein
MCKILGKLHDHISESTAKTETICGFSGLIFFNEIKLPCDNSVSAEVNRFSLLNLVSAASGFLFLSHLTCPSPAKGVILNRFRILRFA